MSHVTDNCSYRSLAQGPVNWLVLVTLIVELFSKVTDYLSVAYYLLEKDFVGFPLFCCPKLKKRSLFPVLWLLVSHSTVSVKIFVGLIVLNNVVVTMTFYLTPLFSCVML